MLRTLKALFEQALAPAAGGGPQPGSADRLHLATAVLLVEVMRADGDFSDTERRAVSAVLRQRLALDDEAAAALMAAAERSAKDATDLHSFTSALNERLSFEEKVQVVESMWSVAYADGALVPHEQHVLWRVADLLHVPQGAYINAKIRAKAAAEAAQASTFKPPATPG